MKGVLFDLDGTLADSAPDMADALNCLREEVGLDRVPEAMVRPHVSRGAMGVLKACLAADVDEITDAHLQRFLALYEASLDCRTGLFPHMREALDAMRDRGIPWGIVTNKAGYLAEPVVRGLGVAGECRVLVAGDTLPQRKPDPAPVLHAVEALGVPAADIWFIGDDIRDIQAARAAGTVSVAAWWGYIFPGEHPSEWNADVDLQHTHELLESVQRL